MSTELFLGLAGTIIALGAAITTIWQSILSRHHNRLSVKPILRIDRKVVTGEKASIALMNTGVGPAIIRSAIFSIEGNAYESIESGNLVLRKIGINPVGYRYWQVFPKESLSAGEKQSIFESKEIVKSESDMLNIISSFERLSIEIEYESIYEEKFKINNTSKYHETL